MTFVDTEIKVEKQGKLAFFFFHRYASLIEQCCGYPNESPKRHKYTCNENEYTNKFYRSNSHNSIEILQSFQTLQRNICEISSALTLLELVTPKYSNAKQTRKKTKIFDRTYDVILYFYCII